MLVTRWVLGLALLGLSGALVAATGPGIPALSFSPEDEFTKEVARLKAPKGYAHAKAAMIGGYMIVPSFRGGKNKGGIIDVYSLADLPVKGILDPIRRIDNDDDDSLSDKKIQIISPGPREAHSFATFWQDGRRYVVMQASNGIDVWDMTDPSTLSRSSRVANFEFIKATSSSYNGIWWVTAQAPYVYASELGGKMHILNLSDPTAPTLERTLTTSDLGMANGSRVASAHAIGNLLVVATNADSTKQDITGEILGGTYAFLDISDPLNPVARQTWTNQPQPYATLINANRLIVGGRGSRVDVFDISNPFVPFDESLRKTPSPGLGAIGPAGYVNCQDGFAFVGCEKEVVMVDIMAEKPAIVKRGTTSLGREIDNNFGVPLGNLNFFSNDRTGPKDYSAIMVVSAQPDTISPEVNMVNPAPYAKNVGLLSRIGLTFTDELRDETISEQTIQLRLVQDGQVVGSALPCRYTHQTGIVNLVPLTPLQAGSTYQIDVLAGGVQDASGNGAVAFSSQFTTADEATGDAPIVALDALTPQAGFEVTFSAQVRGGMAPFTYSWNFGDGVSSSETEPTHVFQRAGRYGVTVVITDVAGRSTSASATQLVYRQPTNGAAQSSSQMAIHPRTGYLYVANPDGASVTVIHAESNTKVSEIAVGQHPKAVAVVGDELWVINESDATVSVINVSEESVVATIPLARASQPQGLVSDGHSVYVALQALGWVVRIPVADRVVDGIAVVGSTPRALALDETGQRLLVTRFISSDDQAEVVEIATETLSVARTHALLLDTTTRDTENNGRGVPNYLVGVAISPDGRHAFVPAKKDNIVRGLVRDGKDLDNDKTVRAILAQLSLTDSQVSGQPLDFDNQDSPSAVTFNRRGDLMYVAFQGTNHVKILDAYSLETLAAIDDTPLAPQSLCVSVDGRHLYVHGFLGRSVAVYDVSALQDLTGSTTTLLATIDTMSTEPLIPDVLAGKRIFYDASSRHMNFDGYISCATCHLDGGHDGRVWDFTGRGEGLRRTTDLRGRSGVGHGPVHWTANFDEIHDFEHDMRGPFGGAGLLSDAEWQSGTRDQSLGDAKAGVSPELDQLAAYVSSLTAVPPSPHRAADGALTESAVQGREIFIAQNCVACHSGPRLTDSSLNVLHDVGTILPSSGKRLNGQLLGIDTPSLKGLWTTDRFLHDGSQSELLGVFQDDDPSPISASHRSVLNLSSQEQRDLFDYLLQIDETETPAYVPHGPNDLFVLEAEAGALVIPPAQEHMWMPVASTAYGQAGAVQGLPHASTSQTASGVNGPRADYLIKVMKPGDYVVWVTGHGGSVHVGLNQEPVIEGITLSSGEPGWTKAEQVVSLEAGVQTLNVWMGQSGAVVDRLLLTSAQDYVPAGRGPHESATTLSPVVSSSQK